MLKKVLGFYTKYFAVWVVLFGAAAYVWPGPFVALKPYMDWFFALTMFGIGAVLEIGDFKRIAQKPLIVLIGSVTQFTVMPLGAFAV
jgi:BASS family bile acid:Na+ symporter